MRIGLVVPHVFMHRKILPGVIFSPGQLAINLVEGLHKRGADVTLFSPGPIDASVPNITADLSLFEQELAGRNDTYLDLLKKHPFTFITLARQVQSELIAKAYDMANKGELDVVHIYTLEEDLALPFAKLCTKPIVFTHHDPFNFLVKYKNVFPKYKDLNWLSISYAQRTGMPADTNWKANIYHGLDPDIFTPNYKPAEQYIAYLGRIIQSKGVHLAIQAVHEYNAQHPDRPYVLKIAGKHYAGTQKDTYWQEVVEPLIDNKTIQYIGFIKTDADKQEFLGNATALIVPSTFEEPFGMVMAEALACGTPIIGLKHGAIPEVVVHGKTGILADGAAGLATAIGQISTIDRHACRADFEQRFTLDRMCQEHLDVYNKL